MVSAKTPKTMDNRPAKKSFPSRTLPTSRSPIDIVLVRSIVSHAQAGRQIPCLLRSARERRDCRLQVFSVVFALDQYGHVDVRCVPVRAVMCRLADLGTALAVERKRPDQLAHDEVVVELPPRILPLDHTAGQAIFEYSDPCLGLRAQRCLRDQHLSRD